MGNTDGLNIVISGDSSQLVRSVQEAQNALNSMNSRKIDIAIQITGGLQEAGAKIEAIFGSIFKTITAGAMSVAGTLSMITKSALSIGGGFEAQMTSVQVISGATGKDLQDLTDKAREMGATLPISARDAATAMTLLAQRGMQAKDILAAVSEVANLTISQGVDMGSAADILGSTMTNFGIAVDDASKITAIFNNACNQSALSMGKLIEAMKYVGPPAGAMGISLTEAVSGMEVVVGALNSGEMTGTGFARVLAKLATASHIMGVKTKELNGSLRPLKDIFTELKEKGFSAAEAETIFGARGKLAAIALVNNSDALETNQKRLQIWGSTQAAVDAKAKTFTNTMTALRSAIEEFHIEIFTQIKDQAKDAVGSVAGLTREFSKWVSETQIAGKSLNSFLEGLGFKLPSASDFKSLLNEFDVQAFVDKVKDFGSTLRGIGESITSFFNTVKAPLSWLIEHLDTFATISFWGWLFGKGLQVPAAIIGIATSFTTLTSAVKGLLGLSWASLLAHPLGAALATAGVIGGVAMYASSRADEAKREERRIKDEAERIRREVEDANKDLQFQVDIDFKTGFEQLPASYEKASADMKQEIKETVAFLQEAFRVKTAQAVEFVTAKFPEMADAFTGTANDISDAILSQISAALKGSEKDFEALPEIWRKVAERINAVDNGLDKFGVDLLGVTEKYRQLQNVIAKPANKSETETFFDELSAAVRGITDNLNSEIKRANKFLAGENGQLAVQVSLAQAQAKLDKFVKSASEKYALPEGIVKASLTDNLVKLAQTGNDTAQSLINGFSGAGDALDSFLSNAQEAITYLGASPDKFMPALNSLVKGFKLIDPLTGKITEQFKKAHNALKQWSNTTFDQLTGRIQKLRRAVEGGFIDKSALEAEFRRVLPQLKLQVVTELQSQRGQYRNESDYYSVVASEFISKINDLFGDLGLNIARDMFKNSSGGGIGRLIVDEVERSLSKVSDSFKINGIDQLQQGLSSIANLPQNIVNAMNPYVVKIEQLNSDNSTSDSSSAPVISAMQKLSASIDGAKSFVDGNTSALGRANDAVLSLVNSIGSMNSDNKSSFTTKDYSAEFVQVIKEIQNLSSELTAIQTTSSDGVKAVNSLMSAVNSIEAAIKSNVQHENIPLDTGSLTQAIISGITPFISSLEQTSSAYQASSSLISGNVQSLGQNIDRLSKSEENNIVALSQFQNAISSLQVQQNIIDLSPVINELQGILTVLKSVQSNGGNNQDFTAALSPVTAGLQNISAVLDSVQHAAIANIQAVNAVEAAVKSRHSQDNNINFDGNVITQAVVNGLNPLLARIEQGSSILQSSTASASKNIQDLGASLEALKKSVDDNISAIMKVQGALGSVNTLSTQEISSALSPTLSTLQSISGVLSGVKDNVHALSISVGSVVSAVNAVESAVKSQEQEVSSNINGGAITQAVTDGITPLISHLEQNYSGIQSVLTPISRDITSLISALDTLRKAADDNSSALKSQSQGTNSSLVQNLDAALSPIVTALQNISAGITSVQNTAQSNIQAVIDVTSAVNAVESAVKSQQTDRITVNEGSVTQAVIAGVSPLISRIEQNSSIYQASSTTLSKNIQDLALNLETLRKSAENSNSVMLQLQTSVKAAGDSYDATNITSAIHPLTALVQNLTGVLNAIQSINQANGTTVLEIINSVKALENSVKSLETGNNYDIDINQQGFIVEKKSDADTLARSTIVALKSGLGNGGL